MNVGLIEHHRFAIAPMVVLAIDIDVATFSVGCVQSEVITVRTGIRVAVAHQSGARWQLGEHRRLDRANALYQFGGTRAELHGRRVAIAIPLEIEALPAGLEKRVETDVIVLVRTFDLAGVKQILAFGTNFFPMRLQRAQVGKISRIEIRFVGDFRKQIKKAIDRRQERRVITQLAPQLVAHSTTQVNVRNRDNVDNGNDQFHGNRHRLEINKLRPLPACRSPGLVQRLNAKQRPRNAIEPRRWSAFS
ncbi:hypothetical protein D3C71_1346470 [compost metagenome]